MEHIYSTEVLTAWCLTVGLARTLAVPDSGIAGVSRTNSTLSEEIEKSEHYYPNIDVRHQSKFRRIILAVSVQSTVNNLVRKDSWRGQ